MRVVISAGGRFHALHLAHQLEKRGMLECLYTASYTRSDQSYVSSNKVRLYRFGKLLDYIFEKARLLKLIPLSWYYQVKDNLFDCWVCKKIKKSESIDIFVGWAHYVLQILPEVKKRGALVVIETGSMHIIEQRRILEDEYTAFGILAPPIDDCIVQKMLAEYAAADIIMVPAPHVAQSFIDQGVAADKLRCVPYGVNLTRFYPSVDKPSIFTVLFVGQVSLQKGVFYLLSAWKMHNLQKAQLLIVGMIIQDFMPIYQQFCKDKNIIFIGPVSQEQLAIIYRQASVFVLPSLQEGFGMVLAEAMASALPFISTENTGGSVFSENDDCGFVVPIRDTHALSEKIKFLYDNPEIVKEMGKRAVKKVQKFSWNTYGQKVVDVYKKL